MSSADKSQPAVPRTILVTGDVVCDHDFYCGNRATPDSGAHRGFRMKTCAGGAGLVWQLIDAVEATSSHRKAEFGLKIELTALPPEYHAYCYWEPCLSDPNEKNDDKRFEVWRTVVPTLGYGQKDDKASSATTSPWASVAIHSPPDVAVIDDAGLSFRSADSKSRWPDFLSNDNSTAGPNRVVLKLSGVIGEGDLWKTLLDRFSDKLVVVVSADLLRRSDVRISRGLSWEATAEDLLSELHTNPALAPLRRARHLVVTFRFDGAFWIHNHESDTDATLVFDGGYAEGEWESLHGSGGVFGLQTCVTAAIVHKICQFEDQVAPTPGLPDFEAALVAGLSACRRMGLLGNGRVRISSPANPKLLVDNPEPGFPIAELAREIVDPSMQFVTAVLPYPMLGRGTWMMLDELQVRAQSSSRQRPHYDLALALAVLGPRALERFPVAKFGALLTVDRQEIESLRSLRQIMEAYEKGGPQKKPLNIGVFGPPGAGKSFGVTEISKAVLTADVRILTFNLSQFNSPDDLNGAFHQVRDAVLSGRTPVVFWDEFDSQNYRWLQYLLAPMQDGAFQEGQISHPIGKCIFVFAGATSPTCNTFGPLNPEDLSEEERTAITESRLQVIESQWNDFVLKKGPDFRTRLAGHLNVLGPNPRQIAELKNGVRRWQADPSDLFFPIRRAFFIRSQYKLKDSQQLPVDHGVLKALLEIPRFNAGARSLEFLCQQLRQSRGNIQGRSSVPGQHLLQLHVNSKAFWEICERHHPFLFVAEQLAAQLHEGYRIRIQGRPDKKHLDVALAQLDVDMRAANVSQALRIPENLRLIGMGLVHGPVVALTDLSSQQDVDLGEAEVRKMIADAENLELLAEAEHNGWMVERMLRGWRYSKVRNDLKKLHPLLIAYSQLTDMDKGFDRQTIVGAAAPSGKPQFEQFGYVDVVKLVGFRVRHV